jgi:hypothetical protein
MSPGTRSHAVVMFRADAMSPQLAGTPAAVAIMELLIPSGTRGERTEQPLAPFVYPDFTQESVDQVGHVWTWPASAALRPGAHRLRPGRGACVWRVRPILRAAGVRARASYAQLGACWTPGFAWRASRVRP